MNQTTELVSSPIEVRIEVFVHDSRLGIRREGENASREKSRGREQRTIEGIS